ncbi:MAG: hypothetical protein ABI351_12445 [Herbaspirillum sp.]
MSTLHWKAELLHREGRELLPEFLPLEVLIYVARKMALYKDGALDRHEMEGVWSFLTLWIEKLLNAQSVSRLSVFQKRSDDFLATLVDELDMWIRLELVSRQIDYRIYNISITSLFQSQFKKSAKS